MSIAINKERVFILKVDNNEIPTIEVWLKKEHIKKWYGDPQEWLEEIKDISGEYGWLNHYIIQYENIPIGFCQYYDCSKTPKGFEWDNEPPGTFAIDYFIGEVQFLNKGLGSVIIQKLNDLIISKENPKQIIADPVKENLISIKLLEKNGFTLDELTGLYKITV
ncbi:GNAT family N-acetyltransferase [Desulfovibrio litoralis]|uniref:Protein N-acetyltransferase, RimJ/RimL family n=1 Tax=Desulfovibrio litoralis DSM 11393 TaxID=1121455 RepID=A0A1M7TH76_9BACT|nr:GNAT family N-acetyltransferase [Desulfovibrio litoralis]SHN70102.1 Protein N-acetyltransferase, RimJ/RimL family [Desulfovibrio litoralis DSM 11393]